MDERCIARKIAAGLSRRFMAWFLLIIAGLLEVFWTAAMKQSHGFTRLWPSVWMCVGTVASFGLLTVATRTLPLGTAYAVWTGIGVAGSVITGIVLFSESADLRRLACVSLILLGIVGLRFLSKSDLPN